MPNAKNGTNNKKNQGGKATSGGKALRADLAAMLLRLTREFDKSATEAAGIYLRATRSRKKLDALAQLAEDLPNEVSDLRERVAEVSRLARAFKPGNMMMRVDHIAAQFTEVAELAAGRRPE